MRLPGILVAVFVAAAAARGAAQTVPHTHSFKALPEITITGVVDRVEYDASTACEVCQACAACGGVHLVLRKGSDRIEAHLAPAWFLERSGFEFEPGDVVSVTGTRIVVGQERGIAAREVRRDGDVMKFRDEHGLPLWRRELTEP
jgi:hypothetical protein